MAYGRNFGFRRTVNIVREGRSRVPASGTPYRIGTAVVEDTSNPGRLTRPGDGDAPDQNSGIVLFEHIQMQGADPFLSTQYDFDTVPLNQFAQRIHGIGVKVWLQNTPLTTLYDGRQRSAVTIVALTHSGTTPLEVGDLLGPAADGTWKYVSSDGWMQVTAVDHSKGLVEAVLTF